MSWGHLVGSLIGGALEGHLYNKAKKNNHSLLDEELALHQAEIAANKYCKLSLYKLHNKGGASN